MQLADLPNRRVEAWKYSDLRAAMADAHLPERVNERAGAAIIDRLAAEESQRTELTIGAGKSGEFIERLDGAGLVPVSARFVLEPGASLTRVVIQTGSGVPLSYAHVTVGAGARFRQIILADGGRLARMETEIDVVGEAASVELNGVYLCAVGRHADLTSTITHHAGGGQTRQLIKGVARKGGRGVFQGKIVVAPHAQKTDARQYHHGMLLEEGAEIFAKPELMIHADDVQCAHGNTAGGLDERALFYMRSRGVPQAEARALLIESFLVEAIPEGLPQEINDELIGRIRAWLAGGAA
jgi:Fe-S cluster assembly protein SufD